MTTRKCTAEERDTLKALRDWDGCEPCPGTDSARIMESLFRKGWAVKVGGRYYHFLNATNAGGGQVLIMTARGRSIKSLLTHAKTLREQNDQP